MSLLNKPFILGGAAHALGCAALCAPRASTSRRCLEMLTFTTASCSLYYGRQFSTMYDVNYIWAFYMSNFIFHLNSLLNIYCYVPPRAKSFSDQLRLAFRQTINPRGIGMKWEHRGRQGQTTSKTKTSFLLMQLLLADFAFLVICLWDGGFYSPLFLRREDVAPGKEHFFRRLPHVTLRELVIRVIITTANQVEDYFTMLFLHCAISIVGLICGDSPDDWPYMFGDISEAYTIRRYWTKFWQPFLYNPIRSHASFIAHSLVLIPKTSKAARYIKVALGFFLSGTIHVLADFALYRRFNYRGQLSWAVIQVGGLAIEDLVIYVFYMRAAKTEKGNPHWYLGRWIGFLWVSSFLVWSIPGWKYRSYYIRWYSFSPESEA